MKKLLIVAILLTGCAHTEKEGFLTLNTIEGAFNPTVALATVRDDSGKIVIQQIVSGKGTADVLTGEAAKVGAAYVFGGMAAPLLRPSNNNTIVGGSSATNKSITTGSNATGLGYGGNPVSKAITYPTSNASAVANPVNSAISDATGGLSIANPTANAGSLSFSESNNKQTQEQGQVTQQQDNNGHSEHHDK